MIPGSPSPLPGTFVLMSPLEHFGPAVAAWFGDAFAAPTPAQTLGWEAIAAGHNTLIHAPTGSGKTLAALLWGRARTRRSGKPSLPGSSAPASASGRWSLTTALMRDVTPTEQQAARAEQLLERHGVVVRDAVLAEQIPGGFSGLYPVYSALEEVGRVRRGYFVEGRGGAQFALPGAVDRLRAVEPVTTAIAATDPANPYGASIPWPESPGRPSRSAGAYVVLVDGRLSAFIERGGRSLLTFSKLDIDLARVASVVAQVARDRIKRMTIERIDGVPVPESALGSALAESGFIAGYKGVSLHRA